MRRRKMQVRAICVQIAYHSKLEVSSLSGDFKNAHRSPAVNVEAKPKTKQSERIPVIPRVTHTKEDKRTHTKKKHTHTQVTHNYT